GLVLLKVVRDHGLRLIFLTVQIRSQSLVELHDAVLKVLALLIQGTKVRVQGATIDIDLVAQFRATGLEVGEHWLDVAPEKVEHRRFITGSQASFKLRDVSADMERQCRE